MMRVWFTDDLATAFARRPLLAALQASRWPHRLRA
jgi:hypothetical protein